MIGERARSRIGEALMIALMLLAMAGALLGDGESTKPPHPAHPGLAEELLVDVNENDGQTGVDYRVQRLVTQDGIFLIVSSHRGVAITQVHREAVPGLAR